MTVIKPKKVCDRINYDSETSDECCPFGRRDYSGDKLPSRLSECPHWEKGMACPMYTAIVEQRHWRIKKDIMEKFGRRFELKIHTHNGVAKYSIFKDGGFYATTKSLETAYEIIKGVSR